VKILSEKGKLTGIECVRNRLGEIDSSGRRKPVPIPGSEFTLKLDTLIVAISEQPDVDSISPVGETALKINKDGMLEVDRQSLTTSRPGVFAGGDVTTGPNTVVDAIAAGKRAALMIDRYLTGEELKQIEKHQMPGVYVPPIELSEEELAQLRRVEPPRAPAEHRCSTFTEVEMTLLEADARREASRCLRCDLDFTRPAPAAHKHQPADKTVQAERPV
jgi:NADPH-dependent glutamate synthase beta subunit-like oxidoreductase